MNEKQDEREKMPEKSEQEKLVGDRQESLLDEMESLREWPEREGRFWLLYGLLLIGLPVLAMVASLALKRGDHALVVQTALVSALVYFVLAWRYEKKQGKPERFRMDFILGVGPLMAYLILLSK